MSPVDRGRARTLTASTARPRPGLFPARAGLTKTPWWATAILATFSSAVLKTEEVVPVNAMSTWVLPCGVTVGR
ncbi:hypothetical protein C6W96_10175 [Streptomyces sp. CS149]|nr:hypothetical protein C6W96_10175 [Streptomyces sp. CS149]